MFEPPPTSPPPTELNEWLGNRTFDEHRAELDERGYIIFKNVLRAAQLEAIREAVSPHLTRRGRNHFEGYASNRVYALLAKAPAVFGELVTHPLALAFAEAELGTSCLLSALLAINLHPGETAQGWHYDDAQIHVPRPRAAYGLSTFWAIDATTEVNGATEVIPGSHRWDDHAAIPALGNPYDPALKHQAADQDLQPRDDAVKALLPAGSLMVAKGTLWHRGGAKSFPVVAAARDAAVLPGLGSTTRKHGAGGTGPHRGDPSKACP